MTAREEIERDPSTEIVLGLAEGLIAESRYSSDERDIRRAILSWAFADRRIIHMHSGFRGQPVMLGGTGWEFHDGRTSGFSALAHGWFIKLNEWSIWRIEFSGRQFSYNDGTHRLLPWQMMKLISQFERIPQGRFLYREYKSRKVPNSSVAAISFLQEAADIAPSATLVPFNILAKDASVEILAIARLLFAIRLMANYKTKRENDK